MQAYYCKFYINVSLVIEGELDVETLNTTAKLLMEWKFAKVLLPTLGCKEMGIPRFPTSNNKENQTQTHSCTNMRPQKQLLKKKTWGCFPYSYLFRISRQVLSVFLSFSISAKLSSSSASISDSSLQG